jgi:arabinofuranosyltransferase
MTLSELMWATQAVGAVTAVGLFAWPRRTLLLVVGAALLILVLHGYLFWDNTVDDAYISFRYSYNLAHGNGLVWNPGERVEGYSNFLWVLMLAGTEVIGLGIVEPSRWLGFASTAGTLIVMYLFTKELVEDERERQIVFAGAVFLLVSTANAAFWTFAGLEEPLFTFLVLLSVYLHLKEDQGVFRYPISAGTLLVASLTRPEGVAVAALFGVLKLVGVVIAPRDERAARIRWLFVWGLLFAAPYAAFIGWRLWYYGELLPNTYYQKLDGQGVLSWDRYREGVEYVRRFWQQFGIVLIFPLPYAALLFRQYRRVAVPMLAFSSFWMAEVIYAGGDFMQFFRVLLPVLPFAYVLSLAAAVAAIRELIVPSAREYALGATALLTFVCAAWLMHVSPVEIGSERFRDYIRGEGTEIGEWLHTQDSDVVVAVNAVGVISYVSKVRVIDTLGLNDKHIARRDPYTSGYLVPGHKKGDGAYILQRQPDIILINAGLTLLPQTREQFLAPRALMLPADADLLRQPELLDLYDIAWVKLEGGFLNMLVLKRSTKVRGVYPAPAKPVGSAAAPAPAR